VRAAAALPAVVLSAGAAAGFLVPDISVPALAILMVAASALAVCAFTRADAGPLVAAVTAGFAAGGALLGHHAWREAWQPPLRTVFEERVRSDRATKRHPVSPALLDQSAFLVLTGVLRADAVVRPSGVSLSVEVVTVDGPATAARVRGGVLLTVGGTLGAEHIDRWRAGRTIRVPARLKRPERYLNPGVPDDERALAARGTTLVGTVKSAALVDVVAPGSPLSEAAAVVRSSARTAIDSAVGRWSHRAAAIVRAIVIGDRAGLEPEVERHLQEAGTYHVIAISGGNIAILSALTLALFRLAGVLGRAAMIAAIGGLAGYAWVVGGGMSVTRATLMAIVYFAARTLDLRGPPLNALAVVAGVMVTAFPLSIADPGFLLTCGATGAILAGLPKQRPLKPLVASLAASVAAEAVLLPLTAFFFSRVTVAGPLFGLVAIPSMAIAQVAGMAVVPASLLSPALASLVGLVACAGAEGLIRSASLIDHVPALTWRVAPPSAWVLVLYYAGLTAAWTLWRRRAQIVGSAERGASRRFRVVASAAWSGAAIWIVAQPWTLFLPEGGSLRVTFLDVGQGDAALVRFPRGDALVVDAGGLASGSSFDVGDRVVAPVLRHVGLRRVRSLVLTHGDADHTGGAPAILREFKPRDVWEGIPVPRLEWLKGLREAASETGAQWLNVKAGERMAIDGVQVIVRHPGLPEWERQRVRNDDSIVLELVWRDVSIVLTGDIGGAVEQTIATRFEPARIRVVKVPHHGSASSSTAEFLEAMKPQIAIVSAGRGNRFGHPAAAVLERYREAGAEIFRTDRDGAVTIETDGTGVKVSTFTGRRFQVG
jgi:competence protein ComEC